MENQWPLNSFQKQENNKDQPFLTSNSQKTYNLQEYLEDQCHAFLHDFNPPSKTDFLEISKSQIFTDLKFYQSSPQVQEENCEQIYLYPNKQNLCDQSQTVQANQGKRPRKTQKSSQYSKNYRQKKKEKLKLFEQQNYYLKRKVDQLQSRLRQKQLQLNRLKFGKNQEEYNVQVLNDELIKKLNLITQNCIEQLAQNQDICLTEKEKTNKQLSECRRFFDAHGFGGQRTRQVLQYYTNEFLQNVMRDRQKYYLLLCVKQKYLRPEKTSLDIALKEFVKLTEEQTTHQRLYLKELKPLFEQLLQKCRKFQRTSKQVVNILKKIHLKLSKDLSFNDIHKERQRIKNAIWFQLNQHRKEMRNIRSEWIDLVKDQEPSGQDIGQLAYGRKSTKHSMADFSN